MAEPDAAGLLASHESGNQWTEEGQPEQQQRDEKHPDRSNDGPTTLFMNNDLPCHDCVQSFPS